MAGSKGRCKKDDFMKKHLVLVGGGHAHMSTLLNLGDFVAKGHRVTLIGPSQYHYYSGMGPGMLSGMYRPQELRFNIRKMVEDRGASFVKDRVVRLDPAERMLTLANGENLHYDVVSFNTGSEVPALRMDAPEDRVVPVKPIINLLLLRRRVLALLKERPLRLVVVGGGPAGVEVTANLWRLVRDAGGSAFITLVGGSGVLANQPPKVRRLAVSSLSDRGIRIVEGVRVDGLDREELSLSDRSTIPCDCAVLAAGVIASHLFVESGLRTGEGGRRLGLAKQAAVVH